MGYPAVRMDQNVEMYKALQAAAAAAGAAGGGAESRFQSGRDRLDHAAQATDGGGMSDAVKDTVQGQGGRDPGRAGACSTPAEVPPGRDARRTSASTRSASSRRSSPSRRPSTSRCRSTPTSPTKSEFDISTVDTMVRAVENLIAAQK